MNNFQVKKQNYFLLNGNEKHQREEILIFNYYKWK